MAARKPVKARKTTPIIAVPCVTCTHATQPEDPRMEGFLRCQLALGFFVSTTHPRQCPRYETSAIPAEAEMPLAA